MMPKNHVHEDFNFNTFVETNLEITAVFNGINIRNFILKSQKSHSFVVPQDLVVYTQAWFK